MFEIKSFQPRQNQAVPHKETKEQKQKPQNLLQTEHQAQTAGEQESEKSIGNLEGNLSQLLELAENDDIDEQTFENTLHPVPEKTNVQERHGVKEINTEVAKQLVEESKEVQETFEIQFYDLLTEYQAKLKITDLTKPITITKDRFAKLPAAVQQVHTVNEIVNPKELLAQAIYHTIISQKTDEIKENVRVLHEPKNEAQAAKIKKILTDFDLRDFSQNPDEEAVLPVGIEDLKRLNGRLNAITDPHERRDVLNDFVAQMSQAVGISPEDYQMQLNAIMQEIKGLETLKLTVALLHKDGKLAETINDDGTLNTKFFTEYYQTASEQIAPKFKNFETVIEPKEEGTRTEPIQPAVRELTLEQAKKNPVISDIAAKTPLIAKHFLTRNSAVRIFATPEGNVVEMQLDKNNQEHAVSLRINEETKKSDIFIAGKAVMETSLEDHELHRNLNSCSANHMILEELKIPKNCFISEPVDTKGIEENNDSYQLVKTVLGKDDFPETAVLSVTPSLIGTFKKVLSIALGDDFKDANSSGEIERILEKNGWLDVNGKLVPEANVYFAEVYQMVKRNPSISSKAEFEEAMRG